MASMLDWSLYYQKQGLSIIPVQGKKPLILWKEYQERCASEEEIRSWYSRWPEADIGLVTGKISQLLVLDIDGEEGFQALAGVSLPTRNYVHTRRGKQFYFTYPKDFTGKTTLAGLLSSVDCRGEGGYVKACPSRFSDNSGRYQAVELLFEQLEECPQWLLDLLIEHNKPRQIDKESGESWFQEALNGIRNGNRNQTFTKLAGSLRSRGYSANDIYSLLRLPAREADFPDGELNTICTSVGSYAPRTAGQNGQEQAQSVEEFLAQEEKVDWIVPGVIAKRSIGFIAGMQGTSKTWIMMDLAIEAARGGGHWLGKFPVNSAKVLFIDQERFKGEIQRRIKALLMAKDILNIPTHLNGFHIKSGSTTRLNLQNSFEAFRRELLEIKPDLVIVDSFATFHTSSENDRTEIQKVLELIKALRNEIGCTFMFINHEGKGILHHEPGESKQPNAADMMGSVAVPAAAELVLTVRRKDEESCVVYNTKNTLAPTIEPFEVSVIDLNQEKTKIKVEGK